MGAADRGAMVEQSTVPSALGSGRAATVPVEAVEKWLSSLHLQHRLACQLGSVDLGFNMGFVLKMQMLRFVSFLGLLLMVNASHADSWTLASKLPGIRVATQAESDALNKEFGSTQIINYFESGRFYIYEGDLVIEQDFDVDTTLLVRGNVTVKGFYNDYRNDIGTLLVTGDLSADRLYSWGALYVGGDLNVAGLAMAVYNDFTFEVSGKVNARALVISDKSGDYTSGKIEVELNDMSSSNGDQELSVAARHLLPELFTLPDHFEPAMDDDFYALGFDDSRGLELLTENRSPFREQPGAKTLYADVFRALRSDLAVAEQKKLLHSDLLLAQIISTRADLSDEVAVSLAALKDPVVNTWLAMSKPELTLAQSGSEISPALAKSLAENPGTTLTSITKLAEHPQAEVRSAVAKYQALPDSVPGRKLLDKLVSDPDPEVRAAMLDAFGYASAFGWTLEDAVIQARLADTHQTALNGLAYAQLNAAQTNALLPKLDEDGLAVLAKSLRQQVEQARPTRMTRKELSALANQIITKPVAKDNIPFAATNAFLALPADDQLRQLPTLIQSKGLELGQVMREANSHRVLTLLAKSSLEHSKMIDEWLAENEFLPAELQMQIVRLAMAAKPKADDDYSDHPIDALEDLLGNDAIVPEAVDLAVDMALANGLNPEDGGFQNALFHCDRLSRNAIQKLNAKLKGDEDWALTMQGQANATTEEHVYALKRWYDDDEELHKSLKGAEKLSLDQFYERAARSASINLQQYALAKADLDLALVKVLMRSEHAEVASAAKLHPQVPLADLDVSALGDTSTLEYLNRNKAEDWLELSKRLPTLRARAMAGTKYAQMLRKAVP